MSESHLPGAPPTPGVVAGLDDVTAALAELRRWAGSPSYARLALAVRDSRLRRGVPPSEASVGKITVYDCFQPGRRRINADLVVELVRVLGVPERQVTLWRQATRRALSPAKALRSVTVDASLPPAPSVFAGRKGQLGEVLAATGPVVVDGMAGSGKSALALAAAHRLLSTGQVDVALHADLRGASSEPTDPQAVIGAFLRVLSSDGSGADTSEFEEMLQSALQGRRALFVLDDAESGEQVAPLIVSPDLARVIVTSRHTVDITGSASLSLAELDDADAVELLAGRSGRAIGTDGDRRAMVALADLVGKLPLALCVCADRLAGQSDWTLEEHISAYQERLAMLQLDPDLEGALTVTLDGLDTSARECLLVLGLHPGSDFGPEVCAAMLDGSPDTAADLMARLGRSHLLRSEGPERWGMHDLIRALAERRAMTDLSPTQRRAAMDRMLHHYLTAGMAAVATMRPVAVSEWFWLTEAPTPMQPESAATAWLDREYRNLAAATAWAADHRPELAARLGAVAAVPLWDRADMDATLTMHRTALAAASRLGDDAARALASRHLGQILIRAARFADAQPLLEQAERLHHRLGDTGGEMSDLNGQAVVASMTGDLARALPMLRRLVAHYERAPRAPENDDRLSAVLSNLAIMQYRTGEKDAAIASVERARDLAVRHGWTRRELTALSNLSEMLYDKGRFEEAEAAARRSLELSRRETDHVSAIYALTNLAQALTGLERVEEATEAAEEAIAMSRESDAPDALATTLNNRAEQLVHLGEPDAARPLYDEALALAQQIGETHEAQRAEAGLAALATRR